jgi:serine/threonine protein kinase
MIGQRLGSYEIVDKLGAGGMGEVYRARDTKLGRDVAIKVVLAAYLADRDRLTRFEREARALAALNHPNIATLHGMEESEGRHFLVMELVAGQTLSEAIAAGPIPTPRAIDIARQISEALEAAHDKGIVHRDLKPANVKITADDKVKILDFGLAMIGTGEAGGSAASLANSPTLTAMGTQAGMILGTASYMSPEQARGASGDHRSDVFSFGVVLFEMLTGRQPFQGETVSDVLASVLARDPDLAALPKHLSPRLTDLLARCLDKHPKRRWQAMGDIRLELEVIAKDPAAPAQGAPISSPPQPLWRRALAPIAGLALGAAVTAMAFQAFQPAPPPPEAIAFEFTPPSAAPVLSLSPDGRHVIFGTLPTENEPASKLWIRSLASVETRPLPGTEGSFIRRGLWIGNVPWSPDSRSIAFVGPGSSLYRLDIASGQSTELLKAPASVVIAGAWNPDGSILYAQRNAVDARGGGVWRIAASGGTPVQVTELKTDDLAHRPSTFLPDGRRFFYTAYSISLSLGANEIRMGSIDRAPSQQDTTALFIADGPAVYAPPGYVLFVRRGGLMAQAFDASRGVLAGTPPVQIASGVGPNIAVSGNGRLLYRAIGGAEATVQTEIVRFDRNGKVLRTIGPPGNYGDINVLADGVRFAATRSDSSDAGHIFIVDPSRNAFTRLNPGEPLDFASAVAPDNLLAYTFSPEGISKDIYVRDAGGVGEPRVLVRNQNSKHANSWTRDGRFLIYDEHVPGRSQDLMMVRREGGAPVALLATEWDETFAMVSPDGKWLAYRSTESGKPEVYVRDFNPDRTPAFGSQKIQISVDGGDKPRWSRDGREIFFLNGEVMMAVALRSEGSTLKPATPAKLFDVRWSNYIPYDVLGDGTFLVNAILASQKPGPPTPVHVLVNWESAIRK